MIRRTLLLAALSVSVLSTGAFAATEHFHAKLTAASEVPTNDSKGTGSLSATLDTKTRKLTYTVAWKNLSGPATMAHFHGPAAAGQNAGVVVPLGTEPKSPIKGSVVLTPEQEQQLEGGMWYVNVHTAANKGGEIRGQVEKGKK